MMKKTARKSVKSSVFSMFAAALFMTLLLGTPMSASADEADARRLLKAMSDYLAAQKVLSFEYDSTLEVVTKDAQKLALASSGAVTFNRPDKI